MGFFNTISNTILNIIFPVRCLSCTKSGSEFCLNCITDMPYAERETVKWIFPIYDYRHPPIKKALWLLKYKGKKKFANIFAEILYDKIIEELSDLIIMENFSSPILIPIPLSKKRYKERGYNQAELICRELIRINNIRDGVDIKLENNILIKIKETAYQARIENRKERLKNIISSFAIRNETLIKNRNIILIDDITTTGATLSEAKKVLKNSGARKIIAFTVAH